MLSIKGLAAEFVVGDVTELVFDRCWVLESILGLEITEGALRQVLHPHLSFFFLLSF